MCSVLYFYKVGQWYAFGFSYVKLFLYIFLKSICVKFWSEKIIFRNILVATCKNFSKTPTFILDKNTNCNCHLFCPKVHFLRQNKMVSVIFFFRPDTKQIYYLVHHKTFSKVCKIQKSLLPYLPKIFVHDKTNMFCLDAIDKIHIPTQVDTEYSPHSFAH